MIRAVISDMDGVLYRGKNLIPGAKDFVTRLLERKTPFLFLTNNSEQTPIDLKRKLESLGIEGVREENFITSAMATAEFLRSQKPGATIYVIGGGGLASEMYRAGFSLSDSHADYVVVGKTSTFNFEMLKKAVRLIEKGAKFIGTNPDVIDPAEEGIEPACGTLLAAIEAATGKKPYIVGKPNPMMMLVAKRHLGCHAAETLMVGDRMDTDIVGGMEAGMKTALVLSGVTTKEMINDFPYLPNYVFNHVGEIDIEKLGE
ncbi:HAD family hydrolase [Thermospira aquatica]|uniref:HAD family hydrolase n=1 Tax=Thermospira aquatica TaxID=2828656 RepID=A0AAX3BCZ5_9SPIR|nr:HAD-IIA family hydrolase [Thermospira aquatica]URA10099.1 HAD family hydrolase [Thermospira aquatica]